MKTTSGSLCDNTAFL